MGEPRSNCAVPGSVLDSHKNTNRELRMRLLTRTSAWLLLTAALTACGGGTQTSDMQQTQFNPAPIAAETTATVAIVLTDYAVDEYDQALATIDSIELLGTDGTKQVILDDTVTVDLLALRDELKILAVSDEVEPGDFEKIRMHASNLTLVQLLDDGTSIETQAKLVGNGKIDLNPRKSFTLNAGDIVFVSLDWDMKESLKLTEAGPDKHKVIMRPVIFVDIGTEPGFKEGLVRVSGSIAGKPADNSYFRICSADVNMQNSTSTVANELCLDIVGDDNTGLFGANGEPTTIDTLTDGDAVSVVGWLRRSGDNPALAPIQGDTGDLAPTAFQVLASVAEVGDNWARFRGTVQDLVDDASSTFPFLLDPPDDTTGGEVVTAQLYAATRIYRFSIAEGISEVSPAELAVDDRALVDAVEIASEVEGDPSTVNVALMLSRTPPDGDASIIGEIISINTDDGTLLLLYQGMEQCVSTDADTAIFEVTISETGVETHATTLDMLDIGSKALVSGIDDNGCISSELIIAEAQTDTTP